MYLLISQAAASPLLPDSCRSEADQKYFLFNVLSITEIPKFEVLCQIVRQ